MDGSRHSAIFAAVKCGGRADSVGQCVALAGMMNVEQNKKKISPAGARNDPHLYLFIRSRSDCDKGGVKRRERHPCSPTR